MRVGSAGAAADADLARGGVFLVGKAAQKIFETMEIEHVTAPPRTSRTFTMMLLQIMLLDVVFSLDSVITAVGLAKHLSIMVVAMIIAVTVMLLFANLIGDFVTRHPSVKVLALAFLILIGVMLVVEALERPIPRGYIYFAMAFALAVEMINIRVRRVALPSRHRQRLAGRLKRAGGIPRRSTNVTA